MVLEVGMYVRVPVVMEENDLTYPRSFVAVQIVELDDVSAVAKVRYHDLHRTRLYYPDIEIRKEYSYDELVPVQIPCGTRVRTPLGLGRVVGVWGKRPKQYAIWIDNGEVGVFEEAEIQADYSIFYQDPSEMLARYEFQHPSWYIARSDISRQMHIIQNAVYGFSILTGCRIFLKPFQVVTVARCLESQPVRFMLADEVGLGKTIEACAIIRVMQEQQSDLRVLYIMPAALIEQWRFELITKFAIRAERWMKAETHTPHVLMSYEELLACHNLDQLAMKFDFVLVDEGHHVISDEELYGKVKVLSNSVEHFLLLSATPIQDRKEEYLRLLRLLNPKRYDAVSQDIFNEMIEKQKLIQEQLYFLYSDIMEFDAFSDVIHDNLREIAATLDDGVLQSLVAKDELSKDEAAEIIGYVSEHYRLEANVIRNRRITLQSEMPERTLKEAPYHPATLHDLYPEFEVLDSLLEWIQQETDENPDCYLDEMVFPLLAAAFSSPWALENSIASQERAGRAVPKELTKLLEHWKREATYELDNLAHYLDHEPDAIRGRLAHCVRFLDRVISSQADHEFKAVVFTQFVETLEPLYNALKRRLGNEACVAFHRRMEIDDLDESIERFQADPCCRVLVCDELGGEGRNFQMADLAIHVDTPWLINKVEQRIGRLDRIGRPQEQTVVSVVFYAKGTIEERLFELWRDGMRVYSLSLSGLEIVSRDINCVLRNALLDDLRHGLSHALPEIHAEMERMISAVREEQFYDLAAFHFSTLIQAVSRSLDHYQDADRVFARSMRRWCDQCGFRSNRTQDGFVEFRRELFNPRSSEKVLLPAPEWEKYTLSPQVKRKGRIVGTYDREKAIKREDLLFFAPGDPVFDTVIQNALHSYRGRVCGFSLRGAPFNFSGLMFIWNVEPNMRPIVATGLDPRTLVHFRSFLPIEQVLTLYPFNETSKDIGPMQVAEFLERIKSDVSVRHFGGRTPRGGMADVERFMKLYAPEHWRAVVRKARAECAQMARQFVSEQLDFEVARELAKKTLRARRGAGKFFGYDHSDQATKYAAILNAIEKYCLVLDSVAYLELRTDDD